MQNKMTVIITTYHESRRKYLDEIIGQWLLQCPNIILANGGKSYEGIHKEKITDHIYHPDPGNKIRFMSAAKAKTRYVCLVDDDIVPENGFLRNIFVTYVETGGIVGIMGRIFDDDNYFKCSFIKSSQIKIEEKVDMVGILYFCERNLTEFDYSKIKHRAIDDMTWQMKIHPDIEKWVAPTKSYHRIFPEKYDKYCIFHDPECKRVRQQFYEKWRKK